MGWEGASAGRGRCGQGGGGDHRTPWAKSLGTASQLPSEAGCSGQRRERRNAPESSARTEGL